MHSGLSAPGAVAAGAGGAYRGQDGPHGEKSRSGATGTTGFSLIGVAVGAGAGIVAGATYLLSRAIRGSQEGDSYAYCRSCHQQHSRKDDSCAPTGGARAASGRADGYLPTVGHFSRLPGEEWAKFNACVIDSLRSLGFVLEDSTEDIFAGMTQKEIRQRINSKFKKTALIVHPDKCHGGDDLFRVVLGARDDLLQRLGRKGQ